MTGLAVKRNVVRPDRIHRCIAGRAQAGTQCSTRRIRRNILQPLLKLPYRVQVLLDVVHFVLLERGDVGCPAVSKG